MKNILYFQEFYFAISTDENSQSFNTDYCIFLF